MEQLVAAPVNRGFLPHWLAFKKKYTALNIRVQLADSTKQLEAEFGETLELIKNQKAELQILKNIGHQTA